MNLHRFIALMASGAGLAACSSFADLPSLPDFESLDLFSPAQTTTTILIQSDPRGAEARTSLGATCRTPCTLPIASAGDFTVSYAMNGYEPQTVTVHSSQPPAGFLSSATPPVIDPNPVFATLLPVAPAKPPPKKRPPA